MQIQPNSDQRKVGMWPGQDGLRESIAHSGGNVIVLVSGGLDSCVLLASVADVAEQVRPLFVRNGHPWEEIESAALRRFVKALACPNILPIAERSLPLRDLLDVHWGDKLYQPKFFDGYSANFIPGRNLALLSVASLFGYVHGASSIALGLLADNPYPDSSRQFFSSFEKLFAEGLERPLKILTPFVQLPKEDVVRIGASLPLGLTLSCVNPIDGEHCGDGCNKCAERQKAFALAGVADPTRYRNVPPQVNWKTHKWPD
jgi:7-cyano-7-deazaguanine synthase